MDKNLNIKIPANISIEVQDSLIYIKGDLGEVYLSKRKQILCAFIQETNILECTIVYDSKIKKQRVFLNNEFKKFITNLKTNIKGVSKGFFTELKLLGVGFRFLSYKNNEL